MKKKFLNIKKKFILFFILVNLQEFIKVLKILMNVKSNTIGTKAVFKFCLENKIKFIYSATSASLGNKEKIKIYHLMLLLNQKI